MPHKKSKYTIKLEPIDYFAITTKEDSSIEDKYVFKAFLNQGLINSLEDKTDIELPEFKYNNNFVWNAPTEPGLHNSEYIIQSYYGIHNNPQKAFDIDYYTIIKDDIRNFRKLNTYQIEYIKDLSEENKTELLEIYSKCMNSLIDTVL